MTICAIGQLATWQRQTGRINTIPLYSSHGSAAGAETNILLHSTRHAATHGGRQTYYSTAPATCQRQGGAEILFHCARCMGAPLGPSKHASRIPTNPSQNSHFCDVRWLWGVVGLRSLLEHGRTKRTTTKKKSAKRTTMTRTTTTGVNSNTFAIVRSGSVS